MVKSFAGIDDCDREWAIAKLICEELLVAYSLPNGVVGGCASVYDCARGLVSERCGGNVVVH
jgi:hypothetical protein